MDAKLTVVVGPTAAGKTDLGIKLAEEKQGAVVSADSRQIYAGFNIGTAKPKEAWQTEPHGIMRSDTIDNISHFMLSTYSPLKKITLHDWQQDAFKVIDRLFSRGHSPLLVGGTMLYIDSIIFNYDIPRVPPDLKTRKHLDRLNAAQLYEKLITKDPAAGSFIEPHHKERIIRALEVIESSGKTFSEQRNKGQKKYDYNIIGIFPGWDKLKQRIEKRARAMWEEGLVQETEYLINRYGADLPLLKTMNYAQTVRFMENKINKDMALEEICRVNYRYAKRQMSWWKGRSDIEWIESA